METGSLWLMSTLCNWYVMFTGSIKERNGKQLAHLEVLMNDNKGTFYLKRTIKFIIWRLPKNNDRHQNHSIVCSHYKKARRTENTVFTRWAHYDTGKGGEESLSKIMNVLGHDSALVSQFWAGDTPGIIRWILLWIMPLVQDRSLDLLASSPARYQWITDAPHLL